MSDTNETPKPEQPIAVIVIKVSAFLPRPENPEIGNLMEADPIKVPVYASGKKKQFPDGLFKNLRDLIGGLTDACHDHVFEPMPEMPSPKTESTLVMNPDAGIKGLPEVTVFIPGADGRPVEMPKIGLVDAQGIELE